MKVVALGLETREQVHICLVSLRYLYENQESYMIFLKRCLLSRNELKAMSKVRIWKLLMYNQRVVGGNVD